VEDTPARLIMLDYPAGVDPFRRASQDARRSSVSEAAVDVAAGRQAAAPEDTVDAETVNGRLNADGVPAVLHDDLVRRWQQDLLAEYRPIGPTERVLVSQLARHAAGCERWEAGGGAVGRQLARFLPNCCGAPGEHEHEHERENATADSVLAAVATADVTDRCERHSRAHARAFLKTLSTLMELQAARRERERSVRRIPPGFVDEAACEEYLADRFRTGAARCPCGSTAGYLVPSRKCWECRSCKRQLGYRIGTLMARSPLPLRPWFEAIRLLLWQPELGAAELAGRIGVSRLTTVRGMMQRIQAALESERAAEELAGLAEHFAVGASPEPGEREFRSPPAETARRRQEGGA
jgi:hypothetical protein